MLRRIVLFALLISVGTTASAQIMAVFLKNTKAARKYKKHLVRINGEWAVAGEVKSGIDFSQPNVIKRVGETIELYVANPSKPEFVPYRLSGGVRVKASKKSILAIPQDSISNVRYLMRNQTLYGLAQEYRLKLDAIADLENRRNAEKRASSEWFKAQRRVISAYERLRDWLDGTLYKRAAKKYDKVAKKEQRVIKEDAIKERAAAAQASIHAVATPEDLLVATQRITGGRLRFKVQESQHLRVIYWTERSKDGQIVELLKHGERIIESWRRHFIDPYVSDEEDNEFADPIPDGLFAEWWLGPEDVKLYEAFRTEFYGAPFTGPFAKKSLQMSGSGLRSKRGVDYIHYWKVRDQFDHEGAMAHDLGHDLSNLLFNHGGFGQPQDWISEGAGYWVSFEFLGRNTVTCKEFKQREYNRDPGKEGEKVVAMGMRATFNKIALNKGVSIDQLALKSLFQMDNADLAKSWSFFDWLAQTQGLKGIRFMQSACSNGRTKDGFLDRWRDDAAEIYGIKDRDVFTALDDMWKKYAQTSQSKGGKRRRR